VLARANILKSITKQLNMHWW